MQCFNYYNNVSQQGFIYKVKETFEQILVERVLTVVEYLSSRTIHSDNSLVLPSLEIPTTISLPL